MAKKRKPDTTTNLTLKGEFTNDNYNLLVEMFNKEIAQKIYQRGAKLEDHECCGNCWALHSPKYANIYLNSQRGFEEEWQKPEGERDLLTAAAAPLMAYNVFGEYKASKSSKDKSGYVWYLDDQQQFDEEGNETGESFQMWKLKRVFEGDDLGKDRNKYVMAQAHHEYESDCWMNHRGWRPNLYFFDYMSYLIPLTKEEVEMGITERIKVRAWDLIQGSEDLQLLHQDVGAYILKKEEDRVQWLIREEAERKAKKEAAERRREEELRAAKMLHLAAIKEKEEAKRRKQEASIILQKISSQFDALVESVDSLIVRVKRVGTEENERYTTAIKEKKVQARTVLWLRRKNSFRDYVLTNWTSQYVEDGDIFKVLCSLFTSFLPSNLTEILKLNTTEYVKGIIDAAQKTNDQE